MKKSSRLNQAPEGGVTYESGNPSYNPSTDKVIHPKQEEGITERLGRLRREGKIPMALSFVPTEDGVIVAREVI